MGHDEDSWLDHIFDIDKELMNINIQVIAVETKFTQTAKGGYSMAEVTYKDLGKGNVTSKKIMSFTFPQVFNTLSAAKQGEVYQIGMEKGKPNASGQQFWEWQECTQGQAEATQAPTATSTTSKSAPVIKSTYPTEEERAKTQTYIVKQSCLSNAVNSLVAGAKTPPSKEAVIELAQFYVDFVLGIELGPTNTGFDEMENDEIV